MIEKEILFNILLGFVCLCLVLSLAVFLYKRLPLPLLLYSVIHGLAPVAVSSNGLLCCTMLLFISLLFVITCIASCKWKINRVLGLTMILLYLIFLVICVMLKYRIIVCPVSVG